MQAGMTLGISNIDAISWSAEFTEGSNWQRDKEGDWAHVWKRLLVFRELQF